MSDDELEACLRAHGRALGLPEDAIKMLSWRSGTKMRRLPKRFSPLNNIRQAACHSLARNHHGNEAMASRTSIGFVLGDCRITR